MSDRLEIIFDGRLLVGECPTYDDRTNELLFVDIRGKAFYKMDYSSGRCEKIELPQAIGCLALCDDGGVLLSMEDGIYKRGADGKLTLAHQKTKIMGERFNDGKVGIDGCYYLGTSASDFSGAFYRLQKNSIELLFDGCSCSNGIDWSIDGKTMYYCDSNLHKLEKFDFSEKEHGVWARKKIMDIPEEAGLGDGMAIDADGNIWLAIWGGSALWHINPESGKILKKLEIPAKQVSSCCFAGEDFRDLIITTAAIRTDEKTDPNAGKIFRYRADVGGFKTNRFKEN